MKNKKGFALLIVLCFIALFAIITASYMSVNVIEMHAMERYENTIKAFYLTESGVQAAIYEIVSTFDSAGEVNTYTDGTDDTLQDNLGGGTYSVTIPVPQHVSGSPNYTYLLESTGTINNIGRTIQQSVTVTVTSGEFKFALQSHGGFTQIKENAVINGDVYHDGDMQLKENSMVTGVVYCTGSFEAKEGATPQECTAPSTPEPVPSLNTQPYNDLIAIAAASGLSDQSYNSINLGGATIYVNGDVQVNENSTITGPGTIVATGNISIKENAIITDNVTLVASGEVQIKENFNASNGLVIYSSTNIQLKEQGITLSQCALLSPGEIQIKESVTFSGIIFSEQDIQIKEGSTITGTIVSTASIQVKENCNVTFDPTVFNSDLLMGLESGTSGSSSASGADWTEICS